MFFIDLCQYFGYGKDGSQGEKGDKGDKGADGAYGTRILRGSGAPLTTVGNVGGFYLDRQNFVLYGPKLSSTNWGAGLQLQGKDGNANVKSFLFGNRTIDAPTFSLVYGCQAGY